MRKLHGVGSSLQGLGTREYWSRKESRHPQGEVRVTDGDADGARRLTPEQNADLCSGCVRCCTYITVEIDAPRAAWEYDQWLWALHHEQVSLFLEKTKFLRSIDRLSVNISVQDQVR